MTGRIGICVALLLTQNSIRYKCMTYSHLKVLNDPALRSFVSWVNKMIKIKVRVSVRNIETMNKLAQELDMSVQRYIHDVALSYTPVRDLRLNSCRHMKNIQMKKANDYAWQLKQYATSGPNSRPPEIRFWGIDTVKKRLSDLLEQLNQIEISMNEVAAMPAIKMIEESRENEVLDKAIYLRVNNDEKKVLINKSKLCCLSLSAYIRYIAIGIFPQGRESIQVGEDILSVVADLGRIKGIIKYIFSPNRIHHISSRPFISNAKTVYKVVEKALLLQSKGREILKGIV